MINETSSGTATQAASEPRESPGGTAPASPISLSETVRRAQQGIKWTDYLQGLGVLLGILYVLGFIVVNTHLAQYGVASLSAFETQYVPAGTLVVIVLLLYVLFVGPRLLGIEREIKWILAHRSDKSRVGILWGIVAWGYPLVGLTFNVITAATAVASLVLRNFPFRTAVLPMSLFFMLDYPMLFLGVYERRPKLRLVIPAVVYVFTIAWFVTVVQDQNLRLLLWIFAGLTFILNLVIDLRRRLQVIVPLYVILAISTLVGFGAFFGASMYSQVPRALGGGKPVQVRLLLSDLGATKLKGILDGEGALSTDVWLLNENERELVVAKPIENGALRPLRLGRELVLGVLPVSTFKDANLIINREQPTSTTHPAAAPAK